MPVLQGLAEVIVANTIPLQQAVVENTTKIKALSVGALLAEVITISVLCQLVLRWATILLAIAFEYFHVRCVLVGGTLCCC